MLKRGLEPTDFLDSEVRVTEWYDFESADCRAYRIWICRAGIFWFQRHEWLRNGKNQSDMQPWIQTKLSDFPSHMFTPEEDEQ